VKLELVLIPRKFMMGTPNYARDEAGFHTKIVTAQTCLAASAAAAAPAGHRARASHPQRRRPQLSLSRLYWSRSPRADAC